MAKKNKFSSNVQNLSQPKKDVSNSAVANLVNGVAGQQIESAKENEQFNQMLLSENVQQPELSSSTQKMLNDEQIAEWKVFKQDFQAALNQLKILYQENEQQRKIWSEKEIELAQEQNELAKNRMDLQKEKEIHEQQNIHDLEKLQRKEQELKQKNDVQAAEQEKLAQRENELNMRERDLLLRETDARANFAQINQAAIVKLKDEIADLEKQKIQAQNNLLAVQTQMEEHKRLAENELLQQEQDFLTKKELFEREKSRLERQKQRIDKENRDLEFQKSEIRAEMEQEFLYQQQRLEDELTRLQQKLEKNHDEYDELRSQLAEFEDVKELLARLALSADDFMREWQQKDNEINALNAQLINNQDAQLRQQLNQLRDENRGLMIKSEELSSNLSMREKELSQLKLGVMDKELLEKEKLILTKHKQILELKISELKQEVNGLMDRQVAETPFPQMSNLDAITPPEVEWSEITDLKTFSTELQQRIAQAEKGKKLYFRLEDIRLLIAGLAMSQLHIFQGISGTGKTSLAKAFAKAVGGFCTDISVQAGWRDRDDLLGHYNAFEKKFYERDCLQGLYRASTNSFKNHIHVILLDEMNLSRPEQYFAEFLSALEKNDFNDRVISLSESTLPNAPKCLVEGRKIKVPNNVWFIGTANHDETTNEFADKTYDRAHVMNLPRNEEKFNLEKQEPANFNFSTLNRLFKDAQKQHFEEVQKLLGSLKEDMLTLLLEEKFGLGWGNRFEAQALKFIPVFMACGGNKYAALDHLLANRILRQGKVTGRYDATMQDIQEIRDALCEFADEYKEQFTQSLKLLDDDLKRKERGL